MDDQAAKPPSMVKFAPVMNPDSGPALGLRPGIQVR